MRSRLSHRTSPIKQSENGGHIQLLEDSVFSNSDFTSNTKTAGATSTTSNTTVPYPTPVLDTFSSFGTPVVSCNDLTANALATPDYTPYFESFDSPVGDEELFQSDFPCLNQLIDAPFEPHLPDLFPTLTDLVDAAPLVLDNSASMLQGNSNPFDLNTILAIFAKNNVDPLAIAQIIASMSNNSQIPVVDDEDDEDESSDYSANISSRKRRAASLASGMVKKKRTPSTWYTCDFLGCQYGTSRASNLRDHVGIHDPHRPNPFVCPCGKAFPRNSDLVRHNRSHVKKKAFPCTSCPASFSTANSLTRHQNSRHLNPDG